MEIEIKMVFGEFHSLRVRDHNDESSERHHPGSFFRDKGLAHLENRVHSQALFPEWVVFDGFLPGKASTSADHVHP